MGCGDNHWTGSKVIYLIELNMYNIKVYLLIINISHQESLLEPLLFIIYAYYLPLSLTYTKAISFTGDLTLDASSVLCLSSSYRVFEHSS